MTRRAFPARRPVVCACCRRRYKAGVLITRAPDWLIANLYTEIQYGRLPGWILVGHLRQIEHRLRQTARLGSRDPLTQAWLEATGWHPN